MMMEEGTILRVGEADFEAEDPRGGMLEMDHLLPHQTAGLGEGEAEAEGVG